MRRAHRLGEKSFLENNRFEGNKLGYREKPRLTGHGSSINEKVNNDPYLLAENEGEF